MFLLDGLSYNQGDGEAILEDFDLSSLSRAEIFRGANAFRYGALTLGGAINLVPFTGRDAPGVQSRTEAGSYGYFRANLIGGAVQGAMDEFGSVSGKRRDGFRDHRAENTEILFTNIGFRPDERIENRFYLTLARTDREIPGGVTQEQMETGPRAANPLALAQDWNKAWSYLRLADKFSYRTPDWEIEAGGFWFHRDLETRGFFSANFRSGIEMFYSDNIGGSLNAVWRGEVFGLWNVLSLGANPQWESEHSQNYENLLGRVGRTTARGVSHSVNLPFYAEDQFYLTPQLSFVTGGQLVFVRREFADEFRSDAEGDQSNAQEFLGFNPKLGAIYEFNSDTQVFFNLSRSWQAPSIDNLVEFDEGPNSSVVYTPLQPQHAWTIECGTRGSGSRFRWDLSLYRSWFADELLELNDAQGNDIDTINAQASIHQGIEAGLEIDLFENVFVRPAANHSGDKVTLEQSYTLSDLHFDRDPVYGDNRIGGIPIHFYEAELIYQTPPGFYAAANVACNLSRYPVDHANALYQGAYALLGARIGFRQEKGFSISIEGRNLLNQRYPSSVDVIADSRIDAKPEIFHPGDGRSFFISVTWRW